MESLAEKSAFRQAFADRAHSAQIDQQRRVEELVAQAREERVQLVGLGGRLTV